MKLYRSKTGIFISNGDKHYSASIENWDQLINDDNLLSKLEGLINSDKVKSISEIPASEIVKPMGNQELWACGVTYLRSKLGRQEESKDAGGGDFYARVYEAKRPEVFFKATAHRVVGTGDKVNIRKDSTWDVPEPELTLVVTSYGKIVGYTIGNDMSSRSIEGENPLYLPQAKTYDACAAIGPCIYVTDEPLSPATMISLDILRNGEKVFMGEIAISQMKRTPEELTSFVFRECSFPHGCFIMTGTGIVPGTEFTLRSGDEIRISIENIGVLVNQVR